MKTQRIAASRTLPGVRLALAALLLAAPACREEPPPPPGTILIDDDHDSSSNEDAEHYVTAPRATLRLETRGREVRAHGKQADSIHVLGKGEFRATWDGVSPIELGAETLKPLGPPGKPFAGFELGTQYVIGVGTEQADGARSNLDLMWAGLVDVRAPASR